MCRTGAVAAFAILFAAAGGVIADARQDAPRPAPGVSALIASLGTRDSNRAVEGLVAIGEPAVGALLTELHAGGERARRACVPLARIGTPPAVDGVFEALRAPDPRVAESAAAALRFVRTAASADALTAAMARDTGPIRRSAALSLAAIGDARAIEPLRGMLASPAWYVRAEAARGLGTVATADAAALLVALLDDPSGEVRPWVREALMTQGQLAAGPVARSLDSPSEQVRWQSAWALGRIAAPDAIDRLLGALADSSPTVRREAAVALTRIAASHPKLADALANGLTARLGHSNPDVRGEAAWVLGEIRPPRTGAREVAQGIGAARRCAPPRSSAHITAGTVSYEGRHYRLYPDVLDLRPDIPSPLVAADGTELVLALLQAGKYGIVPATLAASDQQCRADANDFPTLERTGLHSEAELERTRVITGRSAGEINDLARPGSLSVEGFIGADEDIVDVLKDDNRTVAALGMTHPELARPLFHVWNMMRTDMDLGRWDMKTHRWSNVTAIVSHGRVVRLVSGDTKGGQLSIFDDGLTGGFWIEIATDLTDDERAFLRARYPRLDDAAMDALVGSLTRIYTGEMEPHYAMWYGFYEGKTPWRTDPVTLSFVFGLRTIEQIEAAFPGRLYELMMRRFVPRTP